MRKRREGKARGAFNQNKTVEQYFIILRKKNVLLDTHINVKKQNQKKADTRI